MKVFISLGWRLLCCLVLGFSSTASGSVSCLGSQNCFVNDLQNFKTSWTVTGGTTLNMTIVAETTGWVGIGFSRTETMAETDFVMGGVSPDGTAYGSDRFFSSLDNPQQEPLIDYQQNVSWSANEAAGVTTLTISRLLNTGDIATDYDLSSGSYALLWAFRRSNPAATADDTSSYHSGGRGILATGVSFAPVPLPAAVWLFGSVLAGFVGMSRRKLA